MSFIGHSWRLAGSSMTKQALYRWMVKGLAIVILAFILAVNAYLWPIPYLGFNVDPTATIIFVEPGSSAAQAGLQIGDRVIQLYDRPWQSVLSHPNVVPLTQPRERPIPITVEREGAVYTLALVQGVPSIAFQTAKITNLVLVLLCWLTGYLLGVVRRHEASSSPMVAGFWLGLSGVLGGYFFARFASYPLRLALQWFMIGVLIPLSIYIHIWFPPHPIPFHRVRMARRLLFGSVLLVNGGLVAGLVLWQPTLIELVLYLGDFQLVAVLLGFIGSGVILRRAYRKTTTEHVRRQIRLIAMACFFVAFSWFVLLFLPSFIFGETVIADHWVDLLAGAVPLAYLVGGLAPDLYRIDRILLRLGAHAVTTALLVGLLTALIRSFALQGALAILWTATCFVILYRPVRQVVLYLFPHHVHPQIYHPLHTAATKLISTLDQSLLIDTIMSGVRTTFGEPTIAFYAGDTEENNTLTLVVQERLSQLPPTIRPGVVTSQLSHLPFVVESRTVQSALSQASLSSDEERAIHHPGIVLWCPIRHAQGHLLGVLLLGMRGDLDPYRAQDVQELQRLLEAAALALANSAAYQRQCQAEATIRQLYQHLQQAQDATAAAIARELHDEIINVNVRLNIEALQKLIDQVRDPTILAELELLLESERTEAQALRMICEQLHPTGIDDPLGLAAVLRMQVEKIQANWSGTCRLIIEHAPCPIGAQAQREALRIAREALNNAMQHASATEIIVRLRYPDTAGGMIALSIQDNGFTGQVITIKPGHWGVRNMQERARAVGGMLEFRREPDGGTTVVFVFASQFASASV
jgi:signal transduction histidine kinase